VEAEAELLQNLALRGYLYFKEQQYREALITIQTLLKSLLATK
jgi:hypothetical protein